MEQVHGLNLASSDEGQRGLTLSTRTGTEVQVKQSRQAGQLERVEQSAVSRDLGGLVAEGGLRVLAVVVDIPDGKTAAHLAGFFVHHVPCITRKNQGTFRHWGKPRGEWRPVQWAERKVV
ncbi:hypothetical protein D3C84_827750 [compost metagenome]